jgi:hypothetical protein
MALEQQAWQSNCLNCGAALIGKHCHSCGQAAHVHRSLGAFFHDLLHGVFHFEGKIWRTLPLLAWRPGRLTREYINGRRATYVSPIALFLFVVFLTFALFNLLGSPFRFDQQGHIKGLERGVAVAEQNARRKLAQNEQRLLEAKAARRADAAQIEADVEAERYAVGLIQAAKESGKQDDSQAAGTGPFSPWDALKGSWVRAREKPELAIYKLQTGAYKYLWMLIPLSVPFLWLLFPLNRRFRLYDHTVFITYSLCFMLLLLLTISVLAAWAKAGLLATTLALYAPFHCCRQLQEAYAISVFSAGWRTCLLGLFGLLVLAVFSTLLLLLTV